MTEKEGRTKTQILIEEFIRPAIRKDFDRALAKAMKRKSEYKLILYSNGLHVECNCLGENVQRELARMKNMRSKWEVPYGTEHEQTNAGSEEEQGADVAVNYIAGAGEAQQAVHESEEPDKHDTDEENGTRAGDETSKTPGPD